MRNWLARAFALVAVAMPLSALPSTSVSAQSRELWLYNGNVETVSGYFLAGEQISGWCDSDCYDLDLVLVDGSGQAVSEDFLPDAVPVVMAPYSGEFSVRVIMANCSHSAGCAVSVDSTHGF
ncbi:MAG: hypothetical protein HC924_07940 [Synechococcaceae cyanobacterium SM2_3_2]|nr:hypothetical protein [Synechococcaceae cyanobacterium SM2_3_2]